MTGCSWNMGQVVHGIKLGEAAEVGLFFGCDANALFFLNPSLDHNEVVSTMKLAVSEYYSPLATTMLA